MSANKKPRKPHVQRIVSIPALIDRNMTSAAHPMLATRLHTAIITLIERPSIESCNNVSDQLMRIAGGMSWANKGRPIIGKTDAHSIAIRSAIIAIEDVITRYETLGIVAVDFMQARTLRAAAGMLDTALGNIPASCYDRACKEVDEMIGAMA